MTEKPLKKEGMFDLREAINRLEKKEEWGPGPWQSEPDRLEFEHAGFPCLLLRNMDVTGAWCGYVGVPKGHLFFEKDYSDVEQNVEVHWGLTYSGHCAGDICHEPKEGEPDNVWWLGFDCSHGLDLMPLLLAKESVLLGAGRRKCIGKYRTMDYAKAETMKLAEQLQKLVKVSDF